MRVMTSWVLCAIGVAWFVVGGTAAGEDKATAKGTVVSLDEVKSLTPADWKREKPANRLRAHQFRLARAKGDTTDAELAILSDLTGTPEQNVNRWKDMFVPPDGKTLDDVSRVDRLKVGSVRVTYLDVHGTYLSTDRPFAPKSTAKPLPGYRMLAVMFQTPDGSHLIRLLGPAPTVAMHKQAFDAWVKNFK